MTAAATRKLQKEIDNVLKKVDDGISEFSDCWEQATAAGSNQQREKLAEELKRSINKLQRFRVQIREWLAQSGVQSDYKNKLDDSRKRIEHDMQRFKDLERELKTKAFSTCALQKGDELELEEAEKMKYQDWLSQTIQSLNDQLDLFEADLEVLANKKSLNSEDKTRQSQLRTLQERHRWHTKKLELVLRTVDNDACDMGDLAIVKETIDYYVDNNQDADCYHDECLYDCFDLVEIEEKAQPPKSPCESVKAPSLSGSSNGKEDPQKKVKDKDKRRKDEKKDKKEKKTSGLPQKAVSGGATKGGSHGEGKEHPAEYDEIKVQEDQLLSEAAEFICKICQIHVAGCGPKLTSCSHLFCGDCIAQWFNQHPDNQTWAQRAKSAGPDRVVPCPVCKQPLNEKRDLYPVCGVTSRSENLLLWRMLSSLKIICANNPKLNKDGECDWVGEYGSYQKHALQCKNRSGNAALSICSEAPAALVLTRSVSADSESDACSTPKSRDTSVKSLELAQSSGHPTPVQSPSMKPQSASAGALSDDDALQAASGVVCLTSAEPTAIGGLGMKGGLTQTSTAPAPQAARSSLQQTSEATSAASLGGGESNRALASGAASGASVTSDAEPAILTAAAASLQVTSTSTAVSAAASTGNSVADAVAEAAESASTVLQGHAASETCAREPDAGAAFTAKAVANFGGTGANMIPVHMGDLIQVLEQHSSGWMYAKNLSLPSSNCGWIPAWIVPQQPVEEVVKEAPVQPKPQVQSVQPVATPQQSTAVTTPAAVAQMLEGRPVIRASSTFAATSPSQLTLTPADFVEVVERHSSGWTYGRKVSDVRGEGAAEGWFPDWVVAQKSC